MDAGFSRHQDNQQASEAHSQLEEMASRLSRHRDAKRRRFGKEQLARQVVAVAGDAPWPVRRAAADAILRRIAAAEKPLNRYRTVIYSADPLRASCDCADFVRNSLGLCKHVLHAVERAGGRAAAPAPVLMWDPVRRAREPGDALERLRFTKARRPGRPPKAQALFRDDDGALKKLPASFDARLRAVETLLSVPREQCEPAARAVLERAHADLVRSLDVRAVPVPTLKLPLYPYQREGVARFLSRGRLVLADDMGLGKTAQAVAACHALFFAGRVARGVVVVPASLKAQWLREWRMFSDAPVVVVDGNQEERRAQYKQATRGFLIVNYEQLVRDVDAVAAITPDLVVLDEAQRIKNWATKTAQCVKRLTPAYRLVLTGTPMENRLDELATIVDWVDDMALQPRWRLAVETVLVGDGKTDVRGATGLATIRARLAPIFFRRLRADVLGELPGRTDTRKPVALTAEQVEAHDVYNEPIMRLLAMAKKRPLSPDDFLRLMGLMTNQRVICNGMALHQFKARWPALKKKRPTDDVIESLASPKLSLVRDLIHDVAVVQKRKVVVFSQWRRMLELVEWATRNVLEEGGVRSVFFTGHESQKRRTHNLVDFHDDAATRVLYATDAGGVGLNLQRAASAVINVEMPWNPAVVEQRIGRVYRNGQTSPVDAFHVVAAGGIEAHIHDVVGDKRALFTGLFDGTSDEIAFESRGSFLTRLEHVMAPTAPTVPTAPTAAPAFDAGALLGALSRVAITPGPDGAPSMSIPREAAGTLAFILNGLAQQLASFSAPS
jgi:SNF2 family DNA or RNA helicase